VFSAVRAKHDSVGHLLESRCAAATSEVFEAFRHRACRSIEEANVIEREVLAGFSAAFNSFWSVHGKLENSHSPIYTRLDDLASRVREYCGLPNGLLDGAVSNQGSTAISVTRKRESGKEERCVSYWEAITLKCQKEK
jgi:hypothetical protein